MTYHTDSPLKQPPPEPQPPAELWRIAQYNPTVMFFLKAWMHGSFPSYEGMLISLVKALATETNPEETSEYEA